MTNTKKLVGSLLLSATVLSGTAAKANDIKPYVGLDYGFTNADLSEINGSSYSMVYSENFHLISPNIGVKLGEYFGLEASYSQSAKEKKKFSGTFAGTSISDLVTETEVSSFNLDANGYYPLANKFELLASIGVGFIQIDSDVSVAGSLPVAASEDETAVRLGS